MARTETAGEQDTASSPEAPEPRQGGGQAARRLPVVTRTWERAKHEAIALRDELNRVRDRRGMALQNVEGWRTRLAVCESALDPLVVAHVGPLRSQITGALAQIQADEEQIAALTERQKELDAAVERARHEFIMTMGAVSAEQQ